MNYLQGIVVIISAVAMLIAPGYLFGKTDKRFVLHMIVIVSFFIRGIGGILKILHWTGADELLIVSYAGFGLGGLLLIWTGIRNPTGKLLQYQLICGVLIGLIVVNSFWSLNAIDNIVRFLPYPVAALSATIIMSNLYIHSGEKSILVLYFIVAIFAVTLDLFRLV